MKKMPETRSRSRNRITVESVPLSTVTTPIMSTVTMGTTVVTTPGITTATEMPSTTNPFTPLITSDSEAATYVGTDGNKVCQEANKKRLDITNQMAELMKQFEEAQKVLDENNHPRNVIALPEDLEGTFKNFTRNTVGHGLVPPDVPMVPI